MAAFAALILILTIFAIFSIINRSNDEVRIAGGDNYGTLPGADEIYPAVMYQETIYYWKQMAGPVTKLPQGELPAGYEYVGDIEYTDTGEMKKDLQFTAVFEGSGGLYYNSEYPDKVCLRLTTYWLDQAYVIFEIK
jgi:hypothetical protein